MAHPGRPIGSISLTREIWDNIVLRIRAGAYDHVAAEASGVPARTFREWIERGEGRHPTRPPTPRLRAFAQDVARARADARVMAEIRAYREDNRFWLTHVARSQPDHDGWTEPPAPAEATQDESRGWGPTPTTEEIIALRDELQKQRRNRRRREARARAKQGKTS
jgi:hypothetical protein